MSQVLWCKSTNSVSSHWGVVAKPCSRMSTSVHSSLPLLPKKPTEEPTDLRPKSSRRPDPNWCKPQTGTAFRLVRYACDKFHDRTDRAATIICKSSIYKYSFAGQMSRAPSDRNRSSGPACLLFPAIRWPPIQSARITNVSSPRISS